MIRVCFTGHRPHKLGGYNWSSAKNQEIMDAIKDEVLEIVKMANGEAIKFICGGALGVDQMSFAIVHRLKYYFPNITIEVAIPLANQPSEWNLADQRMYYYQLEQADIITLVDTLEEYKVKGCKVGMYHPAKMQKRNEYMVDNSDIVIAVWDGSTGGTNNCIRYAKKTEKTIYVIDPQTLERYVI